MIAPHPGAHTPWPRPLSQQAQLQRSAATRVTRNLLHPTQTRTGRRGVLEQWVLRLKAEQHSSDNFQQASLTDDVQLQSQQIAHVSIERAGPVDRRGARQFAQ